MDPLDAGIVVAASVVSTAAYAVSSVARPVIREVEKDVKAAEHFAVEEIHAAGRAIGGAVSAVGHWFHHPKG
ncbi:hypothetical protein FRC00_011240 [Tulasnella sp. 408]|nr:hypothetical protein FRC00_011240 [Tulasnella sp. 408]